MRTDDDPCIATIKLLQAASLSASAGTAVHLQIPMDYLCAEDFGQLIHGVLPRTARLVTEMTLAGACANQDTSLLVLINPPHPKSAARKMRQTVGSQGAGRISCNAKGELLYTCRRHGISTAIIGEAEGFNDQHLAGTFQVGVTQSTGFQNDMSDAIQSPAVVWEHLHGGDDFLKFDAAMKRPIIPLLHGKSPEIARLWRTIGVLTYAHRHLESLQEGTAPQVTIEEIESFLQLCDRLGLSVPGKKLTPRQAELLGQLLTHQADLKNAQPLSNSSPQNASELPDAKASMRGSVQGAKSEDAKSKDAKKVPDTNTRFDSPTVRTIPGWEDLDDSTVIWHLHGLAKAGALAKFQAPKEQSKLQWSLTSNSKLLLDGTVLVSEHIRPLLRKEAI